MPEASSPLDQAAGLHRHAAAVVSAAATALDGYLPLPRTDIAEQHELSERLRAAAAALAPGWLGQQLDALPASTPLGGQRRPEYVRIGTAQPLDDARFPMLVPLLGVGHVTISADARDARVVGLLRSMVLRLLATAPSGTLIVRTVDPHGHVFGPFTGLAEAGLMPEPVTDRDGLRAVLAEAEHWVRPSRPESDPQGAKERKAKPRRRDRCMLLVIAGLPSLVDGADLARIADLARTGPTHGLHMVIAGWPPAPLSPETTQDRLPLATEISVRNPHVLVGNPPGAALSSGRESFNVPVYLDPEPPRELVERVCQELGAQYAQQGAVHLLDLLPDPDHGWWAESSAGGLSVTVGISGDTPISLHFADLTPHWLVGGRSGAGKTAFLIDVLYGLATRYDPEELAFYLLDFKEGVSFSEFIPTPRDGSWLPHARAVGVESDRTYGLAVLRDLDAEMTRRAELFKANGVSRYVDLRNLGESLPRMVCVIDEFQVLLSGSDRIATEAVALLESVARKGRSFGIHLILASQTVRGIEALYAKRDSIFGQFPVRVALPGGADVLEPTNESAATLQLGTAIVNTAGGLGGPRGSRRAHEKLVRFPDPHADQQILTALRQRLWQARDEHDEPPIVFSGYAAQHLDDDPLYQQLLADGPGQHRPAALLGRQVDVAMSTAVFGLEPGPGRHLAVLGPSGEGADVLEAAVRSLAAQHRPGSVRFALAPLVGDVTPLAEELTKQGHDVVITDKPALPDEIAHVNAYLVVWGMDAASGTDVRGLLRDGPARGVHLLAWWRQLRRFSEDVGFSAGREDVAGLVFLNVPAPDISLLLGESVEWQARKGRALYYDRHADGARIIVPFSGRTA
ncbi:FtsK/SpoIIIE domain-containing protein [Hamadaea tsunoensis]|uniref:FtsK/SpoIIIE domain-containing protein n=1 Tax=Hamadaea tsunoensis TaxID=53368 RepID=UPI000421A97D|nr:FtsK/SpoIIIE domain-containing protein [Hamadaea tsunoensis]